MSVMKRLSGIVREQMGSAYQLDVPLDVSVGYGLNWDQAAQACYGKQTVEQLEDGWLKHLRETKGMTITQLAKKKEMEKGQAVASIAAGTGGNGTKGGTLVRLTAPPVVRTASFAGQFGVRPLSNLAARLQRSKTTHADRRAGCEPPDRRASDDPARVFLAQAS